MNKETFSLVITEIDKRKFKYHENTTFIDGIDIGKISISDKVSFIKKDCKYFIVFENDDCKSEPLCIMIPKTNRFVKCFNDSKYILYTIKYYNSLENVIKFCIKSAIVLKKVFDHEPAQKTSKN